MHVSVKDHGAMGRADGADPVQGLDDGSIAKEGGIRFKFVVEEPY